MKSRTSFFDWATFKKDITRFRVLWVLYAVLLLVTILPAISSSYWDCPAGILEDTAQIMTLLNFLYAALSGCLLFSELFNSRLCNALHAMPVTREARFGSHILAGLAFSFVPNLLISLLAMPALGEFWYTGLLWLSLITMQYVVFFGLSVLSAMCAGSRFAMVMVYGLINFLAPLLYWFISMVFQPQMPGVIINEEPFLLFSPIVQLMQNGDYYQFDMLFQNGFPVYDETIFAGMGNDWLYLIIVAVVGIAAAVAALLLYRRRNLECAGDFIAVKWISHIFLCVYTLAFGAFFCAFGSMFGLGFAVLLVIGLFLGFFTGKMLLEHTTKVFRKKNFLHAGIYTSVLLIAFLVVRTDLFGVVKYVPDVEDVEYITLTRGGTWERDIKSDDHKQTVQTIHQLALDNYCDRDCGEPHHPVKIEYHLRNGRTVRRQYYLCDGTQAANLLSTLISKK